jgi:hypothetical protein
MQADDRHRTHRQVQLPGGREIEVVYLDSNDAQLADCAPEPQAPRSDPPLTPAPWVGDSSTTAPEEALHVCAHCNGGLVHPLDWVEESPGRWSILMRCPDCDALREGVFGQALVERLDEELDRATAALLSDLRQLTHANMVEEIEVFSRALELDLIEPSDF